MAAAVCAGVAAGGDVGGEVAVAVEELVASVEQVDGVGAAGVDGGGGEVVFGALQRGCVLLAAALWGAELLCPGQVLAENGGQGVCGLAAVVTAGD